MRQYCKNNKHKENRKQNVDSADEGYRPKEAVVHTAILVVRK